MSGLTRRDFIIGFLVLMLPAVVSVVGCGGDSSEKRNKKLRRKGDDWLEPGDGKGWGDEK